MGLAHTVTFQSAWHAVAGGALIGLAAVIALVVHGRIAGVSGTLGRALDGDDDGGREFRIAFLIGLVGTGVVVAQAAPGAIGANIARAPVLAVAGLLVGVGTTLANGTSGHGVCGVARLSKRSLVAVAVFMGVAMIAVAIRGVVS